jgi:hypothetical protein
MIKTITKEIFYALSFLLIVLGLLEFIKPRVVLAYFDLNLLLIFCLILGILIVLLSNGRRKNNG